MQWEKASQLIVQEQLVVILIMLGGIFQNKTENFHEGLNSDCHTLLIYRDSFDIRTNQGTSQLLHKKIQYGCPSFQMTEFIEIHSDTEY